MYVFSHWLSFGISIMARFLASDPLWIQTGVRLYQAQGMWARLYGWHVFTYPQHALYFAHCRAVQGIGLKQPLWVVFVDKEGRPLRTWQRLQFVCSCWDKRAHGVIETAISNTKKRHQLWMALAQHGIAQTIPWRVNCFGQRRCDK